MKYSFAILFAFLAFLSLFQSCESPYKEELKSIDDLSAKLDASQKVLESIDREKAEKKEKWVAEEMDSLTSSYEEDTIQKGLFPVFTEIKEVNKCFKAFSMKYRGLKEELDFSRNQLKDLEKDVNNNMLSAEEIEEYLAEETKAINQLQERIEKLKTTVDKGYKNYQEYREKKKKALEKQ